MFENSEFWSIFFDMPVAYSLICLILGFVVSFVFYRKTGKVLKMKFVKQLLLDDKDDELIETDMQSMIVFHQKSIIKLDKALAKNPSNSKLKELRGYHGKILEILEEK